MTDSTTGDLERRVADAIRHKRSWPAEDVARAALNAHAEWLEEQGLVVVSSERYLAVAQQEDQHHD